MKIVSQGNNEPLNRTVPRQAAEHMSYRIHFRPSEDMFRSGTNPIPLLKELQELGNCSVVAQLDSIPPLEECNTELCYTSWDVILTTEKDINIIKDVFIFVEDSCELTIEPIDISQMTDGEDSHRKLGEILVGRGEIKSEDLEKALNQQKRIGEILVDKGFVSQDKVESALAEQKHVNELQEKQKVEQAVATIRVAADKLDKLVDLVGELVTVQARLTQKSNTGNDPELLLISEEVERLTEELRDNTMSIRMVPIGTTFNKFRRLVRDLSNSLHKEVELSIEGAETELDKTVIEQLNDPLVHIIRNSIDHGIELPDERGAVGKPREGIYRPDTLVPMC
jgi:two-component system chemotaxis sensor kinase CheA